jgi:anti-sigma28 factor (negative regulator of flagellin synthesis)
MQADDQILNYMSILNSDTTKHAGQTKENADPQSIATVQVAKVDISPDSAHKAEDEARLERLIAIRQQLAEGTYNISGKDVADKILKVLKN